MRKYYYRVSASDYRDPWISFSIVSKEILGETESEDLGKTGQRNFDRKELRPRNLKLTTPPFIQQM